MSSTRFAALLKLIRFDKPIGTLLLLWPTLWALWLAAEGLPDPDLFFIFVAGTFLMRSAGCIVNDLADRELDGGVARTAERPLVTGEVSVREALLTFGILAGAAFVLVLFTNTLTIALSLVGLLLASAYPFMKRYTHLPQIVLGAAFSWSIPMAFAAQTNALPAELWLLYLANVLWTVAYDTEYAMVDREHDLRVGIKSTAILLGDMDRAAIACLQLASLLCLLFTGQRFGLGPFFYAGLAAAAATFLWQHYLIRDRAVGPTFRAFLNNNYSGMMVFAGIGLHYLAAGGG
jgi:4-hydroxybenzoate polyprenyltransferase